MFAFKTPDYQGSAATVCRVVELPFFLWQYFNGAVGELFDEKNWEIDGDMPVADLMEIFLTAFSEMREACMIGSIIPMAVSIAPLGMLLCDGSEYPADEYPKLAAVLHPSFLSGSFIHLPDMRGRMTVGAELGGAIVGEYGGEGRVTLQSAEMPPHSHGVTEAVDSLASVGFTSVPSAIPSKSETGTSGGGQSHNNMPPYMGVNYYMVTGE